jgi:assimilatory nitrate reductase catalytic subunit
MIAPGQVFMPFHFAETNINEVTQSAFDPFSREPNYKQCAVRIEKTPASATKSARRGFFFKKSAAAEEKRA